MDADGVQSDQRPMDKDTDERHEGVHGEGGAFDEEDEHAQNRNDDVELGEAVHVWSAVSHISGDLPEEALTMCSRSEER